MARRGTVSVSKWESNENRFSQALTPARVVREARAARGMLRNYLPINRLQIIISIADSSNPALTVPGPRVIVGLRQVLSKIYEADVRIMVGF